MGIRQLPYLSHFHPSVSVNAGYLLSHSPMSGKPDLTLHTLTHFLDRFVYRSPKAHQTPKGSSIMQPLAGGDTSGLLVTSGAAAGTQQEPVNSEAFWRKRADQVAAEDVFFHEYFNRVGKDKEKSRKEKKKAAKDPVERDEEADDLSDNESEIWKALVESQPELEGADDSDDDLDMDDLESAFDDDEDDDEGEQGGDDDVIFNDESDEEEGEEEEEEDEEEVEERKPTKADKKKEKAKKVEAEESDEDAFDMDVSDDDAFRDSDEDLPSDMEIGGVGIPSTADDKDKEDDGASGRKKRRKLKHLPTFASVDDYAALLAGEDDGM